MTDPCCGDCRHLMERDVDGDSFLLCSRYPPRLVSTLDGAQTAWPAVDLEDRCGEFQRRGVEEAIVVRLRREIDQLTAELNEVRRSA